MGRTHQKIRFFSTRGFTLLEVMVSVAILAIALTAIFRLQSQSVFLASQAKFETTAPLLARQKMVEYMKAPSEEVISSSGDFGEDFPLYRWKARVEEVDSETLEETSDLLRRVELTVSFGDDLYRYGLSGLRMVEEQ